MTIMFLSVYTFSLLFVAATSLCYYYNKTLPIPMYTHQGVFSPAMNAFYVFGGHSGTTWENRVYVNKVYKWNLSDATSWFDEIGTIPDASWFASFSKNTVLVGNRVFFIGIDHDTWETGKIFVYDLLAESFMTETKTPMPHPMIFGCLATNETHIFMVDGRDDDKTVRLSLIQIYDVAGDSWQMIEFDTGASPTKGLGNNRHGWNGQFCSSVGASLYVLGGTFNNAGINSVYRINLLTFEIEQLNATLPDAQSYGVSLHHDRNLYLVGADPFKPDILSFNLDTFAVSTAFLSQQSFSSAPAHVVNDKIYRFGGRRFETDNDYALDQVEICDLPTAMATTTTSPTSVSPTASPTSASLTPAAPTASPLTTEPSTSSSTTFNPTLSSTQSTTTDTPSPTTEPTKEPSTTLTTTTLTTYPTTEPTKEPTTTLTTTTTVYNITVSIRTDALSSTQILVAVANAFNLTSTPFTVTKSNNDDDGFATVELLVAIASDTPLDYDVIQATLKEAMVDEYGDDIDVDITVQDDDDDTQQSEQAASWSWSWLLPVVVSVATVCVFCCGAVAVVYWYRRRKRMRDNARQLQPPLQPQPQHSADEIEIPGLVKDLSQSAPQMVVGDENDIDEQKQGEEAVELEAKHTELYYELAHGNFKPEGVRGSVITPGATANVDEADNNVSNEADGNVPAPDAASDIDVGNHVELTACGSSVNVDLGSSTAFM